MVQSNYWLAPIAAGCLLLGCGSARGPQWIGDRPLVLPDGSRLMAFEASAPLDDWGTALAKGLGLVQTNSTGSHIRGWSLATGPSNAGVVVAATTNLVGALGSGTIVGLLTREGLNGIAKNLGSMDPQVTVPPIKVPKPDVNIAAPEVKLTVSPVIKPN